MARRLDGSPPLPENICFRADEELARGIDNAVDARWAGEGERPSRSEVIRSMVAAMVHLEEVRPDYEDNLAAARDAKIVDIEQQIAALDAESQQRHSK